jgi:hypothetical protein
MGQKTPVSGTANYGRIFWNQMNSDSAIAHIERAGIEQGIRDCDYLLEMISEDHARLLVGLNECNLIRHLLAIRRTVPRTCFRSAATYRHRGEPPDPFSGLTGPVLSKAAIQK